MSYHYTTFGQGQDAQTLHPSLNTGGIRLPQQTGRMQPKAQLPNPWRSYYQVSGTSPGKPN